MSVLRLPWHSPKAWAHACEILKPPIGTLIEFDGRANNLISGRGGSRRIAATFKEYFDLEHSLPQADVLKIVFPLLQKLIINAPKLFKGFGVGLLDEDKNMSLSRLQIASLLACSLFNMFGKRVNEPDDYSDFSLHHVLRHDNVFPLACLLNYFMRVARMTTAESNYRVIYRRFSTDTSNITSNADSITGLYFGSGFADEAPQTIIIAPCSEFIGDIFCQNNTGITQEEIGLLMRPECLMLPLFTQTLDGNSVVCVIGAEKMNARLGNGSSVKFMGNYEEENTLSQIGKTSVYKKAIVFMNASLNTVGNSQYMNDFDADLHKAFVGFSAITAPGALVATGHWTNKQGGNNIYIKYIQLLLAASAAGKVLTYHIADIALQEKIQVFTQWCTDYTIADIYEKYRETVENLTDEQMLCINNTDLFDLIMG